MENWSHFGIKMENVEKQYNIVANLKFPEPPEDDMLYNLFSELVELDGYIMGVVSTYIKNGVINHNLKNYDYVFLKIESQINEESEELNSILNYKNELDKLVCIVENN